MNPCAPSISLAYRSLSSQSKGLVCGSQIVGAGEQQMFHANLMDVVESRVVRLLVLEACLGKVVPGRPVGRGIETVGPLGSLFVKESGHGPQAGGVLVRRWRVRDEV